MLKLTYLLLPFLLICLFKCIYPNDTIHDKIYFIYKPLDIIATENDDARFLCKVRGTPPPVITWSRKVDPLPDRVEITDSSLHISKLEFTDEGDYVCMGTNSAGTIEAAAKLTVISAPVFISLPENPIIAAVGNKVVLECRANGKPKPNMFWSKEGQNDLLFPQYSSNDGSLTVDNDMNLIITNVTKSNEGVYTCVAINAAGSNRVTVYVSVLETLPTTSSQPSNTTNGPTSSSSPTNVNLSRLHLLFLCLLFYALNF